MAGQIVLEVAGIEDFKNRGNVNHFTFGQAGPAHRLDKNTVVRNKKGGPGDTLPSIDNGGRDIRHVCALSGRFSSRAWP